MLYKIDIPCPGCGKKFRINRRRLVPNRKIACPYCKRSIKVTGDNINKELDEIEKRFKDFGGTTNIKL